MTVTTYQQWLADGSPWKDAAPIDSFERTVRGYGYTVYTIGAVDTHLDIPNPEDHAPFSHTPWPGSQPYPYVLALDIMPGGKWSLAKLGAQIFADKMAGRPGTEWIKYMNWTDSSGDCWHDSWMPGHVRRGSSDRGHIHLSGRTDYVNKPTGYDPIGGGDIMSELFIKLGDSGPGVGFWQYLLNDLGAKLTVDQNYGDATAAAVNAFRAKYGLGPANQVTDWMLRTALRDLAKSYAGKDGQDGAPGTPGKDGVPGKDGKDGQLTGTLTVTGGQLAVETA